jgi:hypothetical protein
MFTLFSTTTAPPRISHLIIFCSFSLGCVAGDVVRHTPPSTHPVCMACLLDFLCCFSVLFICVGTYGRLCWTLVLELTALVLSPCASPAAQNIGTWPGGYGHGQLVDLQRFSRGHFLVWLFWNIGYLLWKVGIFFLVSIVCDCDCGCGSVPSLLRLVYTIDFNELT